MTVDTTAHQSYQGMPRLDARAVNPDGTFSRAWYRLIIDQWKRNGGSFNSAPNACFVQQSPVGAGAPLSVYKSYNGELIGTIALVNIPGEPAVPLVPVASPFSYVAPKDGTLVVFSGLVELSRDSGVTWYKVSLAGGALPMLIKDQARVTWYGDEPPELTFFPIGS